MLRKVISGLLLMGLFCGCNPQNSPLGCDFVRVERTHLVEPNGDTLFIRGTNLGNWLNPEGYMFGFQRTNAASGIDRMLREAVGPDRADTFWEAFRANYITRKDIDFIASCGANTIRLPFHYKLFTEEDYMGRKTNHEPFAVIDSVVTWCRANDLYLILDMHDAPGGQTGDNIDDSCGYPWLLESEQSQVLFCDIWQKIAAYYRDEPTILGYELLNEPIAPYFEERDQLNAALEPLYLRAIEAIRQVDPHHIILIGAPQWNSNFKPLSGAIEDPQVMYTCHRYGGEPTREAIREYIEFRDRSDRPMYMGEIGHNRHEWHAAFCKVMEEANIGYTFWPYKKIAGSCMVGVRRPENWRQVVEFSEAPRGTFAEIRAARSNQEQTFEALMQFAENSLFEHCRIDTLYTRSIGLTIE